MTPLERSIGTFFIDNVESIDFSSRSISARLYVSEAALSRFAKKCGFHGYREFIYSYERDLAVEQSTPQPVGDFTALSDRIRDDFLSVCRAGMSLLDEKRIQCVTERMHHAGRVIAVGIGSSGLAALLMQQRFLPSGLAIEAYTDRIMIETALSSADDRTMLFGITAGGRTREVQDAMKRAAEKKAYTVLMCASPEAETAIPCDVFLRAASVQELGAKDSISAVFPFLILIDVLSACYNPEKIR
jgi:DNA-binding MurR/RpiR family transcriptional regulator